jgi:RecA/RadA recombinase
MPFGKRGALLDELGRRHKGVSDYVNDKLGGMPPEQKVVRSVATQTGIISLDLCLGGGLSSGVTEIYGEESVGKTGVIGRVIARSQQLGKWVMLCSSEFLDIPYLQRMGVDMENLAVARGPMEYMQEMAARFLESPGRVVAVDSLSAMQPLNVDPQSWNEAAYDLLGLRVADQSAMVVTNQVRARRSMDPNKRFASGTESSARWVHDMYVTRIELSRKEVRDTEYTLVANIVANQLARPAVWVEIPATKGGGVDVALDRLRAAVRAGVVKQKGPRFYVGFFHLGLGEAQAAAELELNDEVHDLVMDRLQKVAMA